MQHNSQFDRPSDYQLQFNHSLLIPPPSTSFPPLPESEYSYSASTSMDLRNILISPRQLLPPVKGTYSTIEPPSYSVPAYPLPSSSPIPMIREKYEPLPPPTASYQFEDCYTYGTEAYDSFYTTSPSEISSLPPDLKGSSFPSPHLPPLHAPSYYSFSPCPSPQDMVPSPALTGDLLPSRTSVGHSHPGYSSTYSTYSNYSSYSNPPTPYQPTLTSSFAYPPSTLTENYVLPPYTEHPPTIPAEVQSPPKPDPPFPLPWVEPPPTVSKKKSSSATSKPFLCRFPPCKASFNRNHDLKRHERIHTGEKRWECDVCGRAFGRRDALSRHTSAPGGRCKAVYGKRVRKAGLRMEYLLNKTAKELHELK